MFTAVKKSFFYFCNKNGRETAFLYLIFRLLPILSFMLVACVNIIAEYFTFLYHCWCKLDWLKEALPLRAINKFNRDLHSLRVSQPAGLRVYKRGKEANLFWKCSSNKGKTVKCVWVFQFKVWRGTCSAGLSTQEFSYLLN